MGFGWYFVNNMGCAAWKPYFIAAVTGEGDDEKYNNKIPLKPMGVLAPGSAHARPSARPPSTLAEIFWHTCLQSHLQTSPPTP